MSFKNDTHFIILQNVDSMAQSLEYTPLVLGILLFVKIKLF